MSRLGICMATVALALSLLCLGRGIWWAAVGSMQYEVVRQESVLVVEVERLPNWGRWVRYSNGDHCYVGPEYPSVSVGDVYLHTLRKYADGHYETHYEKQP